MGRQLAFVVVCQSFAGSDEGGGGGGGQGGIRVKFV